MRIISESDLYSRISQQVGSLFRRQRTIHVIELSRAEFHELHADGHIRTTVDRGREKYKLYISELQMEVPVVIK